MQQDRALDDFVKVSKKSEKRAQQRAKKERQAQQQAQQQAEQAQLQQESEDLARNRQRLGKGRELPELRQAREEAAAAAKEQKRIEQFEIHLQAIQDLHGEDSVEARAVYWSFVSGRPTWEYNDANPAQKVELDAAYAARLQRRLDQDTADVALQEDSDMAVAEDLQQQLQAEAHPLQQQQTADQRFAAESQNKRRSEQEAAHSAKQARLAETASPMDHDQPERLDDILAYDDHDRADEAARQQQEMQPPAPPAQVQQQSHAGITAPTSTHLADTGEEPVRRGWKQLSFPDLSDSERAVVRKTVKDLHVVTNDDLMASQNSRPEEFLEHLRMRSDAYGLNVDHVLPFISRTQLGQKTTAEMGPWIAVHPRVTFAEFSEEFLKRYPGKPPSVTRLTWKSLSMNKQGSYHAFLAEFNRQKGMINTGEDEVIEQFLLGLSPVLRSHVEFYQNRNWLGSEYQKLVDTTTQRVNSAVIMHTATPRATEQGTSNLGQKQTNRNSSSNVLTSNNYMPTAGQSSGRGSAGRGSANGRGRGRGRGQGRGRSSARPISGAFIGRSATESAAIAQYCFANHLCKFCRSPQHRSRECASASTPAPFQPPAGWNEQYGLAEAARVRKDRDSRQGN